MGRSKRDDMKRKIAQAVNHMANAILDINDVYMEFDEAAKSIEAGAAGGVPIDDGGAESSHRKYAEYLKNVMLSISIDRDAALSFALSSWGLEEDQLLKFM